MQLLSLDIELILMLCNSISLCSACTGRRGPAYHVIVELVATAASGGLGNGGKGGGTVIERSKMHINSCLHLISN